MHKVLKTCGITITGLLMLFGVAGARAAMVNFTVEGIVDSAFGSAYGLGIGSTIYASGTFDDSAISSSPYTVYFISSLPDNTMSILAGSLTLNETQDDFHSLSAPNGSPKLVFDSSANFVGLVFHNSAFDSFDPNTFEASEGSNFADGHWTLSTFSMTPVPVPAALWLFGSGLMGLAAVARRRKA